MYAALDEGHEVQAEDCNNFIQFWSVRTCASSQLGGSGCGWRSPCYHGQNVTGRGTTLYSTRKEGHVLLAWCPPLSLVATDVTGEDGTLLLLGRGWPRASLSSTGRGNLPLPVPDVSVSSGLVAA
jgi:hypothetical protein